jgi:hypothetical protein
MNRTRRHPRRETKRLAGAGDAQRPGVGVHQLNSANQVATRGPAHAARCAIRCPAKVLVTLEYFCPASSMGERLFYKQ